MKKIILLSPVYNDWLSYEKLVNNISNLKELNDNYIIQFVCVDDGSTELDNKYFNTLKSKIQYLNLIKNYGHQKAIALGICNIVAKMDFDYIAILDSDGEDDPSDLLNMLHISEQNTVIFAKRKKRKEKFLFKVLYWLYKLFFQLLTGKKISFGNFSILPKNIANKLTYDSDLLINYSSCVLNNKYKTILMNTNRAERYFGKSKMNYQSLILHGLGAISVHIEMACTRLLIMAAFTGIFAFLGIGIVLYIKFFTQSAIPGWATNFITSLILIVLQSIITALLLTFITLNKKTQRMIIPREDYLTYIDHE